MTGLNPTNQLDSATDTERRWAAEDQALDVVRAAFGGFANPSEACLLWQRKNPMLMRGLLQAITVALDAARFARSDSKSASAESIDDSDADEKLVNKVLADAAKDAFPRAKNAMRKG